MKTTKRTPMASFPAFSRRLKKSGEGFEVQTVSIDANRNLVHAGVHYVPELTHRYLYKLEYHWRRWRRWYDNLAENKRRDYPAKHCPPVVFTWMHPIDEPKQAITLNLR